MRVLNIIEAAYRGTLEEQDDPVIWITHALRGAGAEIDVLLRGNAVNYGVSEQDASGLSFGAAEQTQPPQLASDLSNLASKGARIYAVAESLQALGLSRENLVEQLTLLPEGELPALFAEYQQVWHW